MAGHRERRRAREGVPNLPDRLQLRLHRISSGVHVSVKQLSRVVNVPFTVRRC